jgi:PAS domain S-box-containing protein
MRSQAALRDSESRYRALYENAPVGISLTTLDSRVLSCNRTHTKILGANEKELKEINNKAFYKNPDERELLLEELRKTGFVRRCVICMRFPNSSTGTRTKRRMKNFSDT